MKAATALLNILPNDMYLYSKIQQYSTRKSKKQKRQITQDEIAEDDELQMRRIHKRQATDVQKCIFCERGHDLIEFQTISADKNV